MRVEFSTTKYEFAHGRKPRGEGQWAFDYGKGNTWFSRRVGTLGEAKAEFKRYLRKETGITFCRVEVAS